MHEYQRRFELAVSSHQFERNRSEIEDWLRQHEALTKRPATELRERMNSIKQQRAAQIVPDQKRQPERQEPSAE